MSKFSRIYRTDLPCSVPFKSERAFSWHFAAFQDLHSAGAKLLAHTYTATPIRSLQYITTGPLHPPVDPLKHLLYQQARSYSEQSVWQRTDGRGREITVFVEILGEDDTPLARRCARLTRLLSQDQSRCDLFYRVFYGHWIRGHDVERAGWGEEHVAEQARGVILQHLARFIGLVKEHNSMHGT